jgi:hypothetical protein
MILPGGLTSIYFNEFSLNVFYQFFILLPQDLKIESIK